MMDELERVAIVERQTSVINRQVTRITELEESRDSLGRLHVKNTKAISVLAERNEKFQARIAELESESKHRLERLAWTQAEVKRLRSWLHQVLDAHTEYANNDTIRMIEAELGTDVE